MRSKKYVVALIFALMCVLWMPKEAMAATGGSCGTSSTWSYNNGVLTISGSGVVNDNPWKSYQESITKVIINKGITAIEKDSAFAGCTKLSSVTFPNTLTEISFYAFKGCTALQSITIPKSMVKCGGYCFKNSGLKTVTFENGAVTVPGDMFADCGALQTINFPQTIKTIEDSAFVGCISLAKVTLPQSLGELGFYAFKGCTALQSITIPKSVMKCGGYCFKNSGLKTVTFENGMATVPAHMFADCGALQTINFPQTIKTIEDSAFVGCISLAKVTLPQSLGELGFYAFKGCTALQSITIPKSVVKCGGYCFKNSGLKTVTFENGAVTVPAHMFADCETLQTINFPQTIKTIEDSAFVGCTALTKVTLPWYLESIGFYAFKGCTNLKDITIYQKVKSIDGYAFKNVTGLTIHGKKKTTAQTFAKEKGYSFATCKTPALKGITYKKGSLKYTVVSDYIGGKGTVCVTGLTKNTSSVTIPKTVQLESYKYKVVKINSKAFYKKSKLKKITIQSTTITSIGKNAFKGINKKAVIKVPKSKYSKYKKLLTSKTGFAKKTMKVKK